MPAVQDKQVPSRVRNALPNEAQDKLAAEVGKILADTHVLYVMTLHCHWNIEDPRFISLHQLFEKQYEELAEATDTLAEHIRFFGHSAPSSLKQFLELTSLKEIRQELSGDDMIEVLAQAHETMIAHLRKAIKKSDSLGDVATTDLFTDRLRSHQKQAWFLRSHLTH